MTRRARVLALSLALVSLAAPAGATFHLVSISELMVGMGGDPDAQYVELRIELAGQNAVNNTRLAAFNGDGTVVNVVLLSNHNVASGAVNRRILYGTAAFTKQTGLTPDFTIPTGMISPTSGMVCWGAPSQIAVPPPTWDATNPNNYIDCLAYGTYTGPTRNAPPTLGSSGTPSALPPGDDTLALARVAKNAQLNGNNSTDFALRAPGACTNAATSCTPAGCPSAGGQCAPLACTNGNVDAGEACDDGNAVFGDGCENDCTLTPTPQQLGCRRGILKAGSKFTQAYAKLLAACEAGVLAGKITGPCPDTKTSEKIAKAEATKVAAIGKACVGVSVDGAGFPASCPGIDSACGAAMTSIADVTTCVDCVHETAGNGIVAATFGDFAANPAIVPCQQEVAKGFVKLYQARQKILAKCQDAVLTNKIAGPCPDAATQEKLLPLPGKYLKAVCKKCGGSDQVCNSMDDVPPGDIGITTCPAVVTPSGQDCSAGPPITGTLTMVGCLSCVGERLAHCSHLVSGRPKSVPAACDPVP